MYDFDESVHFGLSSYLRLIIVSLIVVVCWKHQFSRLSFDLLSRPFAGCYFWFSNGETMKCLASLVKRFASANSSKFSYCSLTKLKPCLPYDEFFLAVFSDTVLVIVWRKEIKEKKGDITWQKIMLPVVIMITWQNVESVSPISNVWDFTRSSHFGFIFFD